jgi:hypothetical protein
MANLEECPVVPLRRSGTVGQPSEISVKALAMSVLAAAASVPRVKHPGTGSVTAPPSPSGHERETQSYDQLAACGSSHCAGCYDVGDGRKIHPPKPSAEWLDWLEKWKPRGKLQ